MIRNTGTLDTVAESIAKVYNEVTLQKWRVRGNLKSTRLLCGRGLMALLERCAVRLCMNSFM